MDEIRASPDSANLRLTRYLDDQIKPIEGFARLNELTQSEMTPLSDLRKLLFASFLTEFMPEWRAKPD